MPLAHTRISLFIFSTVLILCLSTSSSSHHTSRSRSIYPPTISHSSASGDHNLLLSPALADVAPALDPAWATVLLGDGGFLDVRYTEKHMLEWGVSALHVVHCLAMIRGALQSVRGLRGDDGWVMCMSTSKDPST